GLRVWVVEEKSASGAPSSAEAALRQLEERPGNGIRLIGTSPFQPDFSEAMRKLVPDLLDVVVIQERAWPEGASTQELLQLGLALLVMTSPEGAQRWRALAEEHPLGFVPPSASAEALWLGLLGLGAAQHRQRQAQALVARL